MRIAAVSLSTITTLLIACAPPSALGDRTADRDALEAANQAWEAAFISRNADAMATLTTDEFVMLPPNAESVRGREAALATWRQVAPPRVMRISLTIEETVMDADIAYTMGTYKESLPNGDAIRHGSFIDIWKLVGDEWRIHRHMFSDGRPPRQKGLAPVPVEDRPVLDSPDQG